MVLYGLIAATTVISYIGFRQNGGRIEHWRHAPLWRQALFGSAPARLPALAAAAAYVWMSVATPAPLARSQTPLSAAALTSTSQPIAVTEFGDFECPGCRHAGLELEALARGHPGRLSVNFVNYPLCHDCNPDVPYGKHKHACLAAKIGIVMKARGKFGVFSQRLFAETLPLDETRIYQIVSELGENAADVRLAAASAETAAALRKDIEFGNRTGVQATPTLVIGGKVVSGGGAAVAQLRAALDTGTGFADVLLPALLPGSMKIGAGPAVASRGTGTTPVPGPSADLFNNPYYSCVRNYYVATTGNDANDGSAPHPWLTIQHADGAGGGRTAGDCVNVAPGTYAAGVQPTHGGNLASATGYVVYRCQTLDGCKITATGGFADPAFTFNTAGSGPNYFIIDGFELAARSEQVYGVGVMAADINNPGSATVLTMHHLWVQNCIIHGYGQAGINPGGTDYQYYIHNTIYDNARVTCDAQGSGIGIVVPKAFPVAPTNDDKTNPNPRIGTFVSGSDFFHNVIEWNVVYNNALTSCGTVGNPYDTDGNNIILDTFNTWNGNSVTYPHPSLVALNVVYNAGGGGVHIFSSNYVTVANNTCYNNYLDPANQGSVRGCIDSTQSFGDTYINNIAVAMCRRTPPVLITLHRTLYGTPRFSAAHWPAIRPTLSATTLLTWSARTGAAIATAR